MVTVHRFVLPSTEAEEALRGSCPWCGHKLGLHRIKGGQLECHRQKHGCECSMAVRVSWPGMPEPDGTHAGSE